MDALLIRKTGEGSAEFTELQELTDDAEVTALSDLLAGALDLLTDEDVDAIAAEMDVDSSALVLVFEHTWMKPVRDAIVESGGELITDIHVPARVVDEVLAAAESA